MKKKLILLALVLMTGLTVLQSTAGNPVCPFIYGQLHCVDAIGW